jgi:hypothetical protein
VILDYDFKRLRKIYGTYVLSRDKIVHKAFRDASRYCGRARAYFSIPVDSKIRESFTVWITQLFQESIGSKRRGLAVKTCIPAGLGRTAPFVSLGWKARAGEPVVRLMSEMYYLQNFIAFYSYSRRINFVNQPCVEKYKKTMKTLGGKDIKKAPACDYAGLPGAVRKSIKARHKFIEIILYFQPRENEVTRLAGRFKKDFPGRRVFVFIGSDWNHHSYQAAYQDKDSLYVLLVRKRYPAGIPSLNRARLRENIQTLRLISYATYLTLENNSVWLTLDT